MISNSITVCNEVFEMGSTMTSNLLTTTLLSYTHTPSYTDVCQRTVTADCIQHFIWNQVETIDRVLLTFLHSCPEFQCLSGGDNDLHASMSGVDGLKNITP